MSPALKLASTSLGVVAAGAAAAGAAVVSLGAVMISAARGTLALADEMSNLSGSTGIGVEALQKFKFAGAAVGVSAEQIALGMQRFQRSLVDGSKESAAALKNLGLSASSLRTMLPEQQLTTLLTTISKIPEPAQRTALAMQLLGRGGAALVPLGASLEEIMKRAEELGVVMDTKTVAASDALGDAIGQLEMTFDGLMNQLGAVITTNPQVAAAVEEVTQAIAELSRWVLQNRGDISYWVSAGILLAVDALTQLIRVVGVVSQVVSGLAFTFLKAAEELGKLAYGFGETHLAMLKIADAVPGVDMSQEIAMTEGALRSVGEVVTRSGAAAGIAAGKYDEWGEKADGLAEKTEALRDTIVKGIQPIEGMETGLKGVGTAAFLTAEELKNLAEAAEKLFKFMEDQALAASMARDEAAVKKVEDAFAGLEDEMLRVAQTSEDLEIGQELDEAAMQADLLAKELKDAADEAKRMSEIKLDTFLEGAVNLVSLFGEEWAKVGSIIANVVKQIKSLPAGASGFEKFGIIASGVGQIGSSIEGSHAKTGGTLKGAASGAMMGAAIGSILPGIGTVIGGVIGGIVGALGGLIGGIKKNAEKLKKAQDQAVNAFIDLFQALQQLRSEIAQAGAEGVNKIIDANFKDGKFTGEFTSAANAAAYVAASFETLRASGMSTAEALAAIGPALDAMAKDAKAFKGTAAEPLIAMAKFAAANAGLLAFVEGLGATVTALAAFGLLTQDLANRIAADLGASIDKMMDGGLTYDQSLAMTADTLLRLKNAAEKSGLQLDDHTQKLIDDAENAGLFEGLADPLEKLVEIQQAMLTVSAQLVQIFGGQIPAAVQKMIDEFNNLHVPDLSGGDSGTTGGGGTGDSIGGGGQHFQHGGYLSERAGGHAIRVAERGTGGEYMVPGKQLEALVSAVHALADSRGGGDIYLDGVKVGEVMGDQARSGGSFLTSINQAQRRRGGG